MKWLYTELERLLGTGTYEIIRKTKVEDLVVEERDIHHITSLAEVAVKDCDVKGKLFVRGDLIVYGKLYVSGLLKVDGIVEVI